MSKRLRVLRVEYPELAAQWHPTKNGELVFDTVKPGSHRKLWWVCDKGHDWDATFSHRATGRGCPFCSGHRVLAGLNDLATTHPELAVEWHPTKNGTLTPQEVSKGSNVSVWWFGDCGHEWEATVANRSKSVRSTGCPVCKGKKVLVGLNDLASVHPVIASQWHRTKNLPLTPQDVTAGTDAKLWWVCDKGHDWEAHGYVRLRSGCPECAARSKGFVSRGCGVVAGSASGYGSSRNSQNCIE